jgi:hypothetical protein
MGYLLNLFKTRCNAKSVLHYFSLLIMLQDFENNIVIFTLLYHRTVDSRVS